MVRVRLKRTGTRNVACFRVVVMDKRSSRDGKAIEELGFYDPRSKEEHVNLERVDGIRGDDAVVAGEPVLVSRSRKKVFLDALNNYISGVAK